MDLAELIDRSSVTGFQRWILWLVGLTVVMDGDDASGTPPSPASAAATSARPIHLQRVLSRSVPRAFTRKLHVQSPRDRDCEVDVRSFEISGLADLALEERINESLACRTAEGERGGLYFHATIRPALLDGGLLSARNEYDFDGGGAHPSDGVSGLTVDLRDGHLIDARDLFRKPTHEPPSPSACATTARRSIPIELAGAIST